MFIHDAREILLAFYFVAVNGDDQVSADHDDGVPQLGAFVAAPQSGAIGCASSNGLHHEKSVVGGEAKLVGQIRVDGDGANAERRATHASQSDQIVDHGFSGIDRNGKSNAGTLPDGGSDDGVNTDDFAMPVKQRASGVTRIDGGVGLDRLLDERSVRLLYSADRTDDALSEGSRESEGIADGINFLPDLKIAGLAENDRVQIRGFDLKHGEVMGTVGADDGGGVFLAVGECDFNFLGFGDYVEVGENVSGFVDDKTGTLALLRVDAVEEVVGLHARRNVHHGC